jgi:Methyltransferase domain
MTDWEMSVAALAKTPYVEDVLGAALEWPRIQRHGLWLEFGVWKGDSLRRIASARGEAKVYGFDSFMGLPEPWRKDHPVGEFALEKIPAVPDASLVVGLFEDMLPIFDWTGPVTFVHIDCDLYSSAKCALYHIRPHLIEGSVIVFDELLSYPGFEDHEWRALKETVNEGLRFRWLARADEKAAIVVAKDRK